MASGDDNRSARHVALPQVGDSGVEKIKEGSALIIGVGGIGCAAASYLAASNIGRLVLNDFDTVDDTNLARQFLFRPEDVGKSKAAVAAERLRKQNSSVDIEVIDARLDAAKLAAKIADVDVVLDGSDNFATRFNVNDACVNAGKPLSSGAAIRFEGQAVFLGPDYSESPCYRCIYKEADENMDNCAGNGVLAPLPGAVGALMAAEALKYLAGLPTQPGRMLIFDGLAGEWRSVNIEKRADCESCGGG